MDDYLRMDVRRDLQARGLPAYDPRPLRTIGEVQFARVVRELDRRRGDEEHIG